MKSKLKKLWLKILYSKKVTKVTAVFANLMFIAKHRYWKYIGRHITRFTDYLANLETHLREERFRLKHNLSKEKFRKFRDNPTYSILFRQMVDWDRRN